MGKKRHKPEEVVAKLRQVDVLLSQGKTVAEAIRSIGVTEVTYYRWRQEFGGLKSDQVKRLKDLETENSRLRRVCVPKTRSGRTDDEVRREWDVTAGCQCAELGDARARLCSETGASERHYSSLHRRAARAADAPRQRQ